MFGIINKVEVNVFMELSCVFDNPKDVVNLISGSSAFFLKKLELLEAHALHIVEAWLGEF